MRRIIGGVGGGGRRRRRRRYYARGYRIAVREEYYLRKIVM
jgi:hypothetical protein